MQEIFEYGWIIMEYILREFILSVSGNTFQEVVEAFKNFLHTIGFELVIFISGAMGGLVRSSKDENNTLSRTAVQMVSGALIANYLTPFIIETTGVGAKIQPSLAFLLGYSGFHIVDWALIKFKKIRNQNSKTEDDDTTD